MVKEVNKLLDCFAKLAMTKVVLAVTIGLFAVIEALW